LFVLCKSNKADGLGVVPPMTVWAGSRVAIRERKSEVLPKNWTTILAKISEKKLLPSQSKCFKMGRKRRTFSASQKSTIALEALREQQPLSELAQKHQVHPSQIALWKKQASSGLQAVFERDRDDADKASEQEAKIALLYQQIGQLQFELDWLKKKSGQP
jgi:transposase